MNQKEKLICLYAQRYLGDDNSNVFQAVLMSRYIRKKYVFNIFKKFSRDHVNLILAILMHKSLITCVTEKYFHVPSYEFVFRDLSQTTWTHLILMTFTPGELYIKAPVSNVLINNGKMTPMEILEKSYKQINDPSCMSALCNHLTFLAKMSFIGCQGISAFDAHPYRALFLNKRENNAAYSGELYERNLMELEEAIRIFKTRTHEDILAGTSEMSNEQPVSSLSSLWTVNRQLCNIYVCMRHMCEYIGSEISISAGNAFEVLVMSTLSKFCCFDVISESMPLCEGTEGSYISAGFADVNALKLAFSSLSQVPYMYVMADFKYDIYMADISRVLTDITKEICSKVVGRRITPKAKNIYNLLSHIELEIYTQELMEKSLMVSNDSMTLDMLFMYREGFFTLLKDPPEAELGEGECLFQVDLESSVRACLQVLQHMLKSLIIMRRRYKKTFNFSRDMCDILLSAQTQIDDAMDIMDFMPPDDMNNLDICRQTLTRMTHTELELVADISVLQEYLESCALWRYHTTENIDETLAKLYY